MIPLTCDQDERTRQAAAQAIGHGRSERATEILLSFLSSEDDALAYPAVEALAGRDEPRVLDALLGMLIDPSSMRNRLRAARALGELQQPNTTVVAALIARLGDSDKIVQGEALAFFSKHLEPKAAGPIAKLIDKSDELLSYKAIFTLEKILNSSGKARIPSDDLVAIAHLKEWLVWTSWYPDEDSNRTERAEVNKVATVVVRASIELERRGLQA